MFIMFRMFAELVRMFCYKAANPRDRTENLRGIMKATLTLRGKLEKTQKLPEKVSLTVINVLIDLMFTLCERYKFFGIHFHT